VNQNGKTVDLAGPKLFLIKHFSTESNTGGTAYAREIIQNLTILKSSQVMFYLC
jgi:hypothetical protein